MLKHVHIRNSYSPLNIITTHCLNSETDIYKEKEFNLFYLGYNIIAPTEHKANSRIFPPWQQTMQAAHLHDDKMRKTCALHTEDRLRSENE